LGLHLLKSVFSVVEHTKLTDGNEWHLAKPLLSAADEIPNPIPAVG
jgi:hypothetical protein